MRQLQVDVFTTCAKYFNLIPRFVSAHFDHKSNANARESKKHNMNCLRTCVPYCVFHLVRLTYKNFSSLVPNDQSHKYSNTKLFQFVNDCLFSEKQNIQLEKHLYILCTFKVFFLPHPGWVANDFRKFLVSQTYNLGSL